MTRHYLSIKLQLRTYKVCNEKQQALVRKAEELLNKQTAYTNNSSLKVLISTTRRQVHIYTHIIRIYIHLEGEGAFYCLNLDGGRSSSRLRNSLRSPTSSDRHTSLRGLTQTRPSIKSGPTSARVAGSSHHSSPPTMSSSSYGLDFSQLSGATPKYGLSLSTCTTRAAARLLFEPNRSKDLGP